MERRMLEGERQREGGREGGRYIANRCTRARTWSYNGKMCWVHKHITVVSTYLKSTINCVY